jgi:hypothetical protein
MFLKALSLLGVVLEAITMIQKLVPHAPGSSKKALVLSILDTAATEGAKVGEIIDSKETTLVAAMIDTAVQALKPLGLLGFTPGKTPDPPPTP